MALPGAPRRPPQTCARRDQPQATPRASRGRRARCATFASPTGSNLAAPASEPMFFSCCFMLGKKNFTFSWRLQGMDEGCVQHCCMAALCCIHWRNGKTLHCNACPTYCLISHCRECSNNGQAKAMLSITVILFVSVVSWREGRTAPPALSPPALRAMHVLYACARMHTTLLLNPHLASASSCLLNTRTHAGGGAVRQNLDVW